LSRLTELLGQVKASDAQLGQDLEREFRALASRRAFGLNFERHRPEAVELPGRPVRKGDKVRICAPRGSPGPGARDLWTVSDIDRANGTADVERLRPGAAEADRPTVDLGDLVVMAEFRDIIYPGLVSTGEVKRSDTRPTHVVINGENFHALQALTFSDRGRIDAIYIDPPYNSGARDWKYNNDYVEAEDQYRHSKWLAMMERRLRIARELMRPERSVILVSIDEKEVHRLALLLEQIFPDADIQMVTSVISAKGAVRVGKFSRVEEHIFVVTLGEAKLIPWVRNMLDPIKGDAGDQQALEWLGLRRREPSSTRGARPNQFYPIFVDEATGHLHSVGDPVADGIDRETIAVPPGTVALWPLKPDGTEMLWGLTPEVLKRNWANGYARVNRWNRTTLSGTVQYLAGGTISAITAGTIQITGKARDGSIIGTAATDDDAPPPKRVWNLASHNAETGGTNVLSSLLVGRRFPYPKSLYAVEDILRFFVADIPNAVILDFFAGSGTTAHAVMRLNRQDGGSRRAICVTNNEVSAEEQTALRRSGLRPGDGEWEQLGICDYITKPRIAAAITGQRADGRAVPGDYRFNDEFPMAEGFAENAEFFTLTYETPIAVSHNLAFQRVAPLLWLRAGAFGDRIEEVPANGWMIVQAYGLLVDLDKSSEFCAAMKEAEEATYAFIVTNDDRRYQSVSRRLPDGIKAVRLYESYLSNFRFVSGGTE
jgi:adenine-specific DNA-methyltransferase